MLNSIIVPLDGSPFGEQALPLAVHLARRDKAELELVSVYEVIPPWKTQNAPPIDPALDLHMERDVRSYLDHIAKQLRSDFDILARGTLLTGESVAPTLAEYVATRGVDLMAMSTHGRGGLSRLWLGDLATKLVRRSASPVMLIRPTESGSRNGSTPSLARVLLPLDGSELSEMAIDHATSVVRGPGTELILLHVIVPVWFIAPPDSAAPLPDESELRASAEGYLENVAARIAARGLRVQTRVVRHPQPARAILDVARDLEVDLIAMDSRVRSGIERLMGSVPDKVVRGAEVPVLLHKEQVGAGMAGSDQGFGGEVSTSRR